MSCIEALSPQVVFAVNTFALYSAEQSHVSVGVPSQEHVYQDIKIVTSPWRSCVPCGFRSQSGRSRIITVVPDSVRFHDFVLQWRSGRNSLSSSAWDNFLNPAYQRIVGMGEKAVPLILREMEEELKTGDPDDWFIALWAITGENPVPTESRGDIREMANAWLEWGLRMGHINGETVGTRISTIG